MPIDPCFRVDAGLLFYQTTDILIIHGDADNLVPVEDGKTYHEILSKRPGPGTNTIQLVKGERVHPFHSRFGFEWNVAD